MSDQPYKRPPITEAVIEIRFETPLDGKNLNKTSEDFAPSYPCLEFTKNVAVEVNLGQAEDALPAAQFKDYQIGFRRSSPDLSEIILLWPGSLLVSQLAPYPGWEEFIGRFSRDWFIWKQSRGYRKISRIGVRFINRIDIEIVDGIIDESQYLNVFPRLPDVFGTVIGYGIQVRLPAAEIGCNVTINSGAVPSPLLGHGSFLLDIDVAIESNVPQNDSDVFGLIDRIRVRKNEVFEACITDKARELFQI